MSRFSSGITAIHRTPTKLLLAIVAAVATAGGATVASARPVARYDLQIVEQRTPRTLNQLQIVDVPLVIRNAGARTWSPGAFNVAYHWRSEDGKILVWDGLRTPIPTKVVPGAEIRLDARLKAPRDVGTALLQWDVVEEHVTWVSQQDPTPPRAVRVRIVPGTFDDAFSILEGSTPRVMWAGSTRTIRMTVRNDGTEQWGPGGVINFSYHWRNPDEAKAVYDGTRTAIPADVGRDGLATIDVRLDAPTAPGLYHLQWDMVHEGVAWFSQRDPTPEPGRRVLVLPNPFTAPWGATLIAFVCLGVALVAVRRQDAPKWVVAIASVMDLVWLAGALIVKQPVVLAEIARPPAEGSIWNVLAGVAAITIVAALLPRRIRPWAIVAIDALAGIVILGDVLYLRFFGDVLSVAAAGAVPQTGQVMQSILSLFAARDAWLVADLVPGIALAILVGKVRPRATRWPALVVAAILVPVLIPGVTLIREIGDSTHGKFVQVFQNVIVVQDIGVLDYHAFDLWNNLCEQLTRPRLTEARRGEIERWFRETAPRRAGAGPWFGMARGDDLVMLQVESMQGFLIGYQVDGQEVTPNLNRWLKSDAMWFSRCSDQTSQGRTSDGEFTTQVSLLPISEGAVAFRFGTNHYDAVAGVLKRRGYTTLSAVPFNGAFWNRLVTHPEYGFDTNLYDDAFQPGERVGWGLNDRDFLSQMVPRLAALHSPWVAYLITLSDHHPFADFPDDLKVMKLGGYEGTPFGNYLHAMHYFDAAFGLFLEKMRRAGLLDHTVIAVWGDHTAGFPWDQNFASAIGKRATEPEFYRTETIPLFVRVPGAPAALKGERTLRCGQTDVAPTVLALLGIDPAHYPFVGRNLLGNPGDGPVVRRYGVWLNDELLYINKGPGLESGRCYDIGTLTSEPLEACRQGDLDATREMGVSRDVITYDLAVPLAAGLRRVALAPRTAGALPVGSRASGR